MYEEEPQLRAVGYCRTAAKDQNSEDKLLEQMRQIQRYMDRYDLEFDNCFNEYGKTGAGLQEAYDYCEYDNDIAYFVVSDLTRISRNPDVVEEWVKKFLELGVEVVRSKTSPIDSAVPSLNKALPVLHTPLIGTEQHEAIFQVFKGLPEKL
jgi:DNA invertase Pin-like site-specific DNA recombinase